MRRDQIHKICLNHALTGSIEYKLKDDKNWLFMAGDYSEGELEIRNFCIRFKNHEIAMEFKQSVDKALKDAGILIENGHHDSSREDCELNENKRLSQSLSLPADFFDYKEKEDCKGCRGCKSDFDFSPTLLQQKPQEELPLEFYVIKSSDKKAGSKPKRVSFSIDENLLIEEKSTAKSTEVKPTKDFKAIALPILNNQQQKSPMKEGNLFSGLNFNTNPTTAVFGNLSSNETYTAKPVFGTATTFASSGQPFFGNKPLLGATASFGTTSSTPAFGTASTAPVFVVPPFAASSTPIFENMASSNDPPTFGAISKSSTFSFAEAAKEFENKIKLDEKNVEKNDNDTVKSDNKSALVPDFLINNSGLSFADLGDAANPNAFSANKNPNSGFIGLTKSNDVFSKFANQKDSNNGTTSADNDDSNANDDNYDPHYEPVLKKLPREIKVSAGEEEEIKIFGERAKLYRYTNDTKEWKERGKLILLLFIVSNNKFSF